MKVRESEGASRQWSAEAWAARQAMKAYAQGAFEETFPMWSWGGGTTILVTQRLYLTPLGLVKGDIVNGLWTRIQTAAASLTTAKVGLFSMPPASVLSANPVAVSADIKAVIGATGPKQLPFVSAYQVQEDDVLYAGIYADGTTPPVMYRNLGASVTSNGRIDASQRPFCANVAATDIVVGTPVAPSVDGNGFTLYFAPY